MSGRASGRFLFRGWSPQTRKTAFAEKGARRATAARTTALAQRAGASGRGLHAPGRLRFRDQADDRRAAESGAPEIASTGQAGLEPTILLTNAFGRIDSERKPMA